jgi:hypothetical protein
MFPFLMASEERRRRLLELAPLLLHPPPIIQASQLLYTTAGITDMGGTPAGIASVAALVVMEMD